MHANRRDLAIDYLHTWSLGIVKRMTKTTLERLKELDDDIVELIDNFDFAMADLEKISGVRVVK